MGGVNLVDRRVEDGGKLVGACKQSAVSALELGWEGRKDGNWERTLSGGIVGQHTFFEGKG